MTYRVKVTELAAGEIDAFIGYVAYTKQEPDNAAKLLSAIRDAIPTLSHLPNRCPLAVEDKLVDRTVRVLILKRSLHLLFWVNEAAREVVVEGFRHAARPPLDLRGRLKG